MSNEELFKQLERDVNKIRFGLVCGHTKKGREIVSWFDKQKEKTGNERIRRIKDHNRQLYNSQDHACLSVMLAGEPGSERRIKAMAAIYGGNTEESAFDDDAN